MARSVSRVMGAIPVERMPTPAPIEGATEGLGEATVLVMVGRDLAGKPLPGPPSPGRQSTTVAGGSPWRWAVSP